MIRGVIPVGDLAKVVFYLMAIANRLGMVGQFTNILQNASASADRIFEVLREPRDDRRRPASRFPREAGGWSSGP
ncbi:MAG: hypothetical protein V9G08_03685 [Dermatophilaceae bacterium]